MTRWFLLSLLVLSACKKEEAAPPPPPASPPAEEAAEAPGDVPASQPASQPENDLGNSLTHEPHNKKNDIAYKDPRCSGAQPCECAGTIVYGQNALAKIGITEEDLANGTLCLLGDFDGNGQQDAAFVGKEYGTSAASVQVLLFDEVGLRDTPALPKKVVTLAIHTKDGKVGLLEPSSRSFFVYQNGKFEMTRI